MRQRERLEGHSKPEPAAGYQASNWDHLVALQCDSGVSPLPST